MHLLAVSFLLYPNQDEHKFFRSKSRVPNREIELFTGNLQDALQSRFIHLTLDKSIWKGHNQEALAALKNQIGKRKIVFDVNPFTHTATNRKNSLLTLPLLVLQKILLYLNCHDQRPFLMVAHRTRYIFQKCLVDLIEDYATAIPAILKEGMFPKAHNFEKVLGKEHFIPSEHMKGIFSARVRYLLHIFDALHLCDQSSHDIVRIISFNASTIDFEAATRHFSNQLKFYGQFHSSITRLSIGEKSLKVVPPTCSPELRLDSLTICNTQIKALPDWIWTQTALTSLSLQGNQLRFIPPEIGRLQSLALLWVHGNELTSLPDELCQNPLKVLYVQNNHLFALPERIDRMPLYQIVASHNRLIRLPETIGALNLTYFVICDNQITEFPDSIINLRKLRVLLIKDNPVHSRLNESDKLHKWTTRLKSIEYGRFEDKSLFDF